MTVSSVTLNVPFATVFSGDRHRCLFDVDLDDLTRNPVLDIRRFVSAAAADINPIVPSTATHSTLPIVLANMM